MPCGGPGGSSAPRDAPLEKVRSESLSLLGQGDRVARGHLSRGIDRSMPAPAASASSAPSDLAWRVVGLLNLYRLLVPIVLVAMLWTGSSRWAIGNSQPELFLSACVTYFTAALLLVVARRLHWTSLRIV